MGTCVNIVYTKSGNGSVMYIQLQSMQCCQINVCWLPLLGTIGDCWWREVIIDLWYGNFHPVSLLGSARNIKQTWCQSHHWKLIRESIKLDGLCWGIKLIKVFGELLYGFFTDREKIPVTNKERIENDLFFIGSPADRIEV